jgi:protein required for attachment to host cells
MNRTCLLVADAGRARLYTFEELAGPAGVPTQELIERLDLVNPERRRRPSELESDSRPGIDRAPNGRGYGVDDHRDGHRDELDRRFAAAILDRLAALAREHGSRSVVLVASPRMLGHLRLRAEPLARSGVTLNEIARDFTRLPTAQIQDHLARYGLLPARERLATA